MGTETASPSFIPSNSGKSRHPNRSLTLLLLALAGSARAEDDCGRMFVRVIRMDGTIERVEPLAAGHGAIDIGDPDARYLVRFRPAHGSEGIAGAPPLQGEVLDLAVHSPVRSGLAIGRGHFQFLAMECDGSFRRLIGFGPHPTIPVAFSGSVEEGGLYWGRVVTRDKSLQTEVSVQAPFHHAAGIHWVNADAYPQLASGTWTAVFRIESSETVHRGDHGWLTGWTARLLAVEKVDQ